MAGVQIDHGWAWLVCYGAFTALLLETGTVKALGVLLPDLREQFTTHTWIVGLMISLVPGFGAVTCPLAGALSKRFSGRYTVMIFSFISSMGFIIGSLAPSVPVLLVSLVIAGFSIGAEVIVMGEMAKYFDENYSLANAFSQSGLSVGVMIMPLLTQLLRDIYGWRGTMLILGGINLHMIISGALLRPINQSLSNFHDDDDDEFHIYQSTEPNNELHQTQYSQKCAGEQPKSLFENVLYYIDLKLFINSHFVSLIIYNFGNGYCLTGWVIYLVPFGLDIGLAPYKATSLSTFGGIGNLIGNLVFPFVNRRFSSKTILYLTTAISGLALAVNPIFELFHSYVGLMFASAVFGCGRGMAIVALYQIVKECIEDDRLTNAVMWVNVSYSLGSVASGFLSGWAYDATGNYTTSFCILSAFTILTLVPLLIVDKANRTRHSADKGNRTQYSTLKSEEPYGVD
ncbi:monocarboxylate transporter 12-like [Amphiura filiformis]|uniref:monocarboxylate transporter 12-like n=1 Tax=Amphiura filiformis TaxID=82378 RepID=UPI003B20C89B